MGNRSRFEFSKFSGDCRNHGTQRRLRTLFAIGHAAVDKECVSLRYGICDCQQARTSKKNVSKLAEQRIYTKNQRDLQLPPFIDPLSLRNYDPWRQSQHLTTRNQRLPSKCHESGALHRRTPCIRPRLPPAHLAKARPLITPTSALIESSSMGSSNDSRERDSHAPTSSSIPDWIFFSQNAAGWSTTLQKPIYLLVC